MGACTNFKSRKIIIRKFQDNNPAQISSNNRQIFQKNTSVYSQQIYSNFYQNNDTRYIPNSPGEINNNINNEHIMENSDEESIHSFNSTEYADNDTDNIQKEDEENKQKKINYFNYISDENCLKILDFFQYKELREIGKVNKKFNYLSKNSKVLVKFFRKRNYKYKRNVIVMEDKYINGEKKRETNF